MPDAFIVMDMRSLWRTLDRRTLRDIALVCLASALVGASFGAIAVAGGLPVWVPIAMSVLVYAGGAQFAAVGVALAGGGPIAAVAAGLVLNARLLLFGFTVSDALGRSRLARLTGAHLVTDETVAFTMRHTDPRLRRAAFYTCGLGMFASWNLAVVAGALAGGAIGDTDALGLDAAFPAVLLALVLPALMGGNKDGDDSGDGDQGGSGRRGVGRLRLAALAGAVIAVATTPFLPAGLPVLLALLGLAATLRRSPDAPDAPGVPHVPDTPAEPTSLTQETR